MGYWERGRPEWANPHGCAFWCDTGRQLVLECDKLTHWPLEEAVDALGTRLLFCSQLWVVRPRCEGRTEPTVVAVSFLRFECIVLTDSSVPFLRFEGSCVGLRGDIKAIVRVSLVGLV